MSAPETQVALESACVALICGAAALLCDEHQNEGARRSRWTKPWLEYHQGSYNQLLPELMYKEKADFQNYTRMSEEIFGILLKKITPLIQRENTHLRESIPVGARLEATLRWLAAGGSYTSLQYLTRISKQSLSIIIPETCEAIYTVLKDEYMKTPQTQAEWESVASDFYLKWNFPHCIGALDGKHVLIQPPRESGSYYFNYKGSHSIILLALVNANYEFLYADVGMNGRASDASAWEVSNLKHYIETNKLGIPSPRALPNSDVIAPHAIVADDAFPMKSYLMKPYSLRDLSLQQRIFNYRLSRARRAAENAFGILANKFRVFLSPINLHPKKVEKIVLACLAMHNMLRRTCPDSWNVDQCSGVSIGEPWRMPTQMLGLQTHPRNVAGDAKTVRDSFAKYFVEEGAVSWQNDVL